MARLLIVLGWLKNHAGDLIGLAAIGVICIGIWALAGWAWALIAAGTTPAGFYLWGQVRATRASGPKVLE